MGKGYCSKCNSITNHRFGLTICCRNCGLVTNQAYYNKEKEYYREKLSRDIKELELDIEEHNKVLDKDNTIDTLVYESKTSFLQRLRRELDFL